MATVEPLFANLRFNKRLDRFTLPIDRLLDQRVSERLL
jgi:hypothetical protein